MLSYIKRLIHILEALGSNLVEVPKFNKVKVLVTRGYQVLLEHSPENSQDNTKIITYDNNN